MEWQEDTDLICPNCGAVRASMEGLNMRAKRCSGCGQTMAFEREPTQEEFEKLAKMIGFELATAIPFGAAKPHAADHQIPKGIEEQLSQAGVLMRTMSQAALYPSLN